MGDMFHISYQRINVILFCYVEPILFALSIISLLYVLFGSPGYMIVGKVALIIMGVVIAIVALILLLSLVKLLFHFKDVHEGVILINYGDEPSSKMRGMFDGTVDWLMKLAAWFHTTYATINIWVYIIFMPLGIITSIMILLRLLF